MKDRSPSRSVKKKYFPPFVAAVEKLQNMPEFWQALDKGLYKKEIVNDLNLFYLFTEYSEKGILFLIGAALQGNSDPQKGICFEGISKDKQESYRSLVAKRVSGTQSFINNIKNPGFKKGAPATFQASYSGVRARQGYRLFRGIENKFLLDCLSNPLYRNPRGLLSIKKITNELNKRYNSTMPRIKKSIDSKLTRIRKKIKTQKANAA
ncbi:MAG TPA: hypothetical protein VGE63_03385 [Candidatus Paceibacterota bacterium]